MIVFFLGCDFALRSCLDWMLERKKVGQSIHPFCDKVKRGKTLTVSSLKVRGQLTYPYVKRMDK